MEPNHPPPETPGMLKDPMVLLDVKGLCKSYQGHPVVQNLSLTLSQGECLALLGPNGAGKTTTLGMLEGLIPVDSGEIAYFGQSTDTPGFRMTQVRERVGVVLQESTLYKRYTVEETLTLFRSFYRTGVDPGELLAALDLKDKASTQVRHLSGGQRQRVLIGCALVHDPDLLFLDEPTTGLDPHHRRALWQILAQLVSGEWRWPSGKKPKPRGLLLTTHSMEEAAFLAHNVAIMDQGRLVAVGRPRDLVDQHIGSKIVETRSGTLEDVYLKLTGHPLVGSKIQNQEVREPDREGAQI